MARASVVVDGAEVIVETGAGVITKVERAGGARNARVEFRATHTNLKDPVGGWLDTIHEDAWELVQRAHAEQRVLEYRIEVKRKDGVDKARPIAELGNREKVRELVRVTPAGEAAAQQATSAPETPPPARSAASTHEEPQPPSRPQEAPPARRPANVAEARPWEPYNTDGSVNLGSYAVEAGAGMVGLALELIAGAELALVPSAIEAVANDLMAAADAIQAGATGHRADRMDRSHPRARGILRHLLRVRPYPLAAVVDEEGKLRLTDEEPRRRTPAAAKAVEAWADKLGKAGAELLRMGVRVSGVDWRDV